MGLLRPQPQDAFLAAESIDKKGNTEGAIETLLSGRSDTAFGRKGSGFGEPVRDERNSHLIPVAGKPHSEIRILQPRTDLLHASRV